MKIKMKMKTLLGILVLGVLFVMMAGSVSAAGTVKISPNPAYENEDLYCSCVQRRAYRHLVQSHRH